MAVDGVSGAISSLATGGSNSALNKVTFDTFLKLLVTQLKNQDPLNPMDGTQFTGQIAQFSTLEQQINSNTYLKQLLTQRDYGQQTLAATYIGKDALVPGDGFVKAATGDTTFGYSVESGARNVKVEIYDSAGQLVKEFKGDIEEGKHVVTWDGVGNDDKVAPAGAYQIKVSAFNEDGKKVVATAYSYGRVSSVLMDGTDIALTMTDGRQVAMSDVMAVQGADTN